ncbi:RNA-binding protein [Halalkaliarchaeum desulfuricum]|uniref:RNA-binding protein n=2 Tax=Halalkaliarchaeum desulfuricum TaxID=2055893 RepID=A0A343TFK8_9EURY|nr:RNA-binding protein [Halalkaliarchaeum desulfuricum]
MATVVMDTSALMMPVECGVRVFEELDRLLGEVDPLAPRPVVEELESLSAGAGEEATAASVGLDLSRRCEVRETDAGYADDAVLELAVAEDAYAVTNDLPLRDRLLEANVPVIGLRGRNTLAITEP